MAIERMIPLTMLQSIGPAGRMATDAATHPEAVQAQSRTLLESLLREQTQQIQSVEGSDTSSVVDADAQNEEKNASLQNEEKHVPDDDICEDTTPSTEGPFLGNVLNHKV